MTPIPVADQPAAAPVAEPLSLRSVPVAGRLLVALMIATASLVVFAAPASAQPTEDPEPLETSDETLTLVDNEEYVARMTGLLYWLADDTAGFWNGRASVPSSVGLRLVPRADTGAQSGCGPVGGILAGYCGADDFIYFGVSFSVFTLNQFGDGALAYVMAHEYGHNVQAERGAGDDRSNIVARELHADCLSGAYLRDLGQRGLLEEGDYAEAQRLAVNLGDSTHGTGRQRVNALHRGFTLGAPSCWERWAIPNVAPAAQAPIDPANQVTFAP